MSDLVSNRKAFHDYEVLETFEAGICLTGTEIKSLRAHGGSLQDSYVLISKGEAHLKNANIAPYRFGNIHNHEERRDRKLLLHFYEIDKLHDSCAKKGLTIVPLALYLKNGRVKVKIAICRGKKLYDKREALKAREMKREAERHH